MKGQIMNVVLIVFSIIIFAILLLLTIKIASATNLELFQEKNKIYINNDEFSSNYSIIFDNRENEKIQINLEPYKSKSLEIPRNIEKIIIIKRTNSILSAGAEIVPDKKSDKITGNAISENFVKNQSFNFAILITCLGIISFMIFRILKKNERKEL